MKNLFYCIYEGVIRQGRFKDLYVSGNWYKLTNNESMYGILTTGLTCEGAAYYELAGLSGTRCTSAFQSPKKIYATLEDCRNDVNGYCFRDYAFEVIKPILSEGIKIENNYTNFIPEVSKKTHYSGSECFAIQLPYWTWNGAKAEKHYFRNIRYHILTKTLAFTSMSGKIEFNEKMAQYGALYATKEECEQDNVIEVVLFGDEGC